MEIELAACCRLPRADALLMAPAGVQFQSIGAVCLIGRVDGIESADSWPPLVEIVDGGMAQWKLTSHGLCGKKAGSTQGAATVELCGISASRVLDDSCDYAFNLLLGHRRLPQSLVSDSRVRASSVRFLPM